MGSVSTASKRKGLKRGPIRDNLEAFGVAILAAVLLKWFCIEAYQIPTSSMQPTLMGSSEASVYDRILVDKIRYEITEPQRWDVAVFRYPLQKNQNYVKRIVGMPGDRLHVAGGNVHLVTEKDGKREYTTLRKPERIQRGLWKEVYPARKEMREDPVTLGAAINASPVRGWEDKGNVLVGTLEQGRTSRLTFQDDADGGLVDRVWDGYPQAVGRAIREANIGLARRGEIVPDVKFTTGIRPEGTLEELAFEIEVVRPGKERLTYALELKDGKAQLTVRQGGGRSLLAQGPQVPCELPSGTTTEVTFWRLDDELVALRDGAEIARLDVMAYPVRDGCELSGPGSTPEQRVNAQMVFKGRGKVAVEDLRISRDQHWVRSSLDAGHVVEVPEGNYWMLGDNTLQSVDARDWTALVVGVTEDGTMVPADTPGARKVRGNKRPVPPARAPDRDETPIVFPEEKLVVMIDDVGEYVKMKSGVSPAYDSDNVLFERLDSTGPAGDWRPLEERVPFVPREDIIARGLLVFWPIWPIGVHRLGFVK